MKKIIAIFLVVLCILPIFAGCSALDDFKEGFKEGYEDGIKDIEDQIDETEKEEVENNTQETEKDDITTENKEKEDFVFGKVNGNTYSSEFTGISCTLPDGWVFHTEEDIKKLNNLTVDILDENIAEMIEKATIIYDMQVSEQATGNNASINLEKLSSYSSALLTPETALKNQIPTMKTSLENVGATVEKIEYQKIELDGKEYDGIYSVSVYNGVKMEQNVISFKKGDYLVYLTVTSTQSDNMDTLLSYFTID